MFRGNNRISGLLRERERERERERVGDFLFYLSTPDNGHVKGLF